MHCNKHFTFERSRINTSIQHKYSLFNKPKTLIYSPDNSTQFNCAIQGFHQHIQSWCKISKIYLHQCLSLHRLHRPTMAKCLLVAMVVDQPSWFSSILEEENGNRKKLVEASTDSLWVLEVQCLIFIITRVMQLCVDFIAKS